MHIFFNGYLDRNVFSNISLNPFNSLNHRIQEIAKKNGEALSDTEIKDLEKAFKISRWKLLSPFGVKDQLKGIDTKIVQQFLSVIAEKKDVSSYLKDYIEFLNRDELVGFLEKDEDALTRLRAVFLKLKHDPIMQSSLFKEGELLYEELFYSGRYFLHNLFETVIASFGFNELDFDASIDDNRYYAKAKLKFYKKMMYTPIAVFQFFSIYLHSFFAGLTAATLSLAIPTTAFLYKKYFRAPPKTLGPLDNFRLKRLDPVYPRQELIQKIHDAFASGVGVLLVGESGVGKTMLVHSLIQEVLKGRSCQFIKEPQIFGCNASLFNSAFTGVSFDKLSCLLEDYKKQVIFFFDEFASFFLPNIVNGSLENGLKTFSGDFKYIIGATTTDEYNKYIKDNKTIANAETNEPRRFQVIHLKEMEVKEIEKALDYQFRQKRLGIDVEDDFFEVLAKNKELHVASAKLESVIKKMSELSIRTTVNELSSLKEKRTELAVKMEKGVVDALEEYNKVCSQIKKIEKEEQLRHVKFQSTKKLESLYQKFKDRRYSLLFKNMDQKAIDCWLKNEAAVKMSQALIQKKRQELGLPLSLTKNLIAET